LKISSKNPNVKNTFGENAISKLINSYTKLGPPAGPVDEDGKKELRKLLAGLVPLLLVNNHIFPPSENHSKIDKTITREIIGSIAYF
jgi:hypothetical protein